MLDKPHWTRGLEIGSHHFQLLDRYHEELIAHRLEAIFDYAWGIHEIRWDLRAISAGQVALTKLDAILPDGTAITCDPADGAPLPAVPIRDLGTSYTAEVYLGVPRLRASGAAEVGASQRFVRDSVVAHDFANGTEAVRVDCLRPNVRLLLEGDPLQDFVTLPCARIIRSPAGQLAFDDTFIPPLLAVSASPYLQRELRRALDALMTRQALAPRSSPRDVTEVVQLWLASLVGSFVPRLADLVHQGSTHPLVAYRVLAELLGSLAPFTRAGDHRIPAFQYDHLGPVFAELFTSLGAVLDALGAQQHRRIPLARFDATTLFADLNEPTIFRNDFFLRVTGADAEQLRTRVPQHVKVASWAGLPELVHTATAGVRLQHEPRPPGSLPGGPGTLYFKLEKAEAFDPIVKTGQMGIHHVVGLPLTDVALFAVEPGGGVISAAVSVERVDRAVAQLDAQIAGFVDAVLHDERFKALEAAWRGLAFVVDRVDFQENTEVVVWSYSKQELEEDFADHSDVTHTRFFRAAYSAEYGQHGGRPYGALFLDWQASAAPVDLELLGRVASVAAMAHAPVFLAASPELLGVRTFSELQAMTNPEAAFEQPGGLRWTRFRSNDDSRYIGVLLPRMLLRLPYREATHGAGRFVYDERVAGAEDYLWGSPIFAFAVRLADSFARYRSYTGVLGTFDDEPAVLDSHAALGRGNVKPPVEVVLSRRLEQSLGDLGFIPLTWDSIRATLRFTTANSVQPPRWFGSSEGGQAATLSHLLGTRLPYLLLASRFAHYLKVLERERLGAHRDSAEIERDLNEWLSQYVVVMDSPSPATRLKYPLRNARVKVTNVDGAAGIHRMEVMIQPHLRYMRQAFSLAVTGRIEAR